MKRAYEGRPLAGGLWVPRNGVLRWMPSVLPNALLIVQAEIARRAGGGS